MRGRQWTPRCKEEVAHAQDANSGVQDQLIASMDSDTIYCGKLAIKPIRTPDLRQAFAEDDNLHRKEFLSLVDFQRVRLWAN